METRGDMLRFAIALRGLRLGLDEDERYRVADDVVQRLQVNGDPWRLADKLPPLTG